MPFAHDRRLVTGFPQQFGKRHLTSVKGIEIIVLPIQMGIYSQ